MEFELPTLGRDELTVLAIRALFEREGYRLFRVGSFESYDLYMQNRSFLPSGDIITFTGADGRLMALKPDLTLSIVKNTRPGECQRVYYNESVFRRSRETGEYQEINQMGLEYIGGDCKKSDAEVLTLAAKSLAAAGEGTVDLSHMGFIEAVMSQFSKSGARDFALTALRDKSPHRMRQAAKEQGLSDEAASRLALIAGASGAFEEVLASARELTAEIAGTKEPLDKLFELWDELDESIKPVIRLDFSILNDIDYYNGLIFQGFLPGAAHPVLSGGRYDNLMSRFGKTQGAVGFALYLDELGRAEKDVVSKESGQKRMLNIALPKGRLGKDVYSLFERAGICGGGMLQQSRKLVLEDADAGVRYYLVKPSDVGSYVEHGVADAGIAGRDTLIESGADVLELADLGLGRCRLVIAGRPDFAENPALPLRVATKYPAVARRYFAQKGRAVEVIKLNGSVELAPLTGLSDVIVDIVESGRTLKDNNLAVLGEIEGSTACLVANRASWRFKNAEIRALLEKLEDTL